MSNYSLEAVATRVNDIESNPQRNVSINVASSTTLPTNIGTIQSLAAAHSGFIAVRSAGTGTDSDEGPNARTVISANVDTSTNRIVVTAHGLESGQTIRLGGTPPEGLGVADDYSAKVIDANTIEICTLGTTSTINITANISSSASFQVKRDIVVAFNGGAWSTTSGAAVWLATVNFKFKYVSQAYRWFVKYAGVSKLIVLASDETTQNCFWSDTSPVHNGFSIGGGRNFEYLTQLSIWGYLGETNNNVPGVGHGVNLKIGAPTGTPFTNNMYNLSRCRMIVALGSSSDNIPIWMRIFGSVYILNVSFDFKISSAVTVPLAACFRCSHGLFSFGNCSIVVWTSNMLATSAYGHTSTPTTAIVALEGGSVYWLGGYGLVQGCTGLGVASGIGGGGLRFGTPSILKMTVWPRNGNNGTLGTQAFKTFTDHKARSLQEHIYIDHYGGISPNSFGNPATSNHGTWT